MKFEHAITLGTAAASLLLAGCMGPAGNPNGQPYANEPGGTIAVTPQNIDTATYDPYAPAAPFADMRAGRAGANQPSPTGGRVPSAPPPAQ